MPRWNVPLIQKRARHITIYKVPLIDNTFRQRFFFQFLNWNAITISRQHCARYKLINSLSVRPKDILSTKKIIFSFVSLILHNVVGWVEIFDLMIKQNTSEVGVSFFFYFQSHLSLYFIFVFLLCFSFGPFPQSRTSGISWTRARIESNKTSHFDSRPVQRIVDKVQTNRRRQWHWYHLPGLRIGTTRRIRNG